MNILICSPDFFPIVGGLSTLTQTLADEFVAAGHHVGVITTTPSTAVHNFSFKVHRCPRKREALRLVQECDVFFHVNLSLKWIWPLILTPRRFVANHNGPYERDTSGRVGWQDRLKFVCMRIARNISVSEAVAKSLPVPSTVIHNPYNPVFRELPGVQRDKDLVFLGRLVSDKGADTLIEALAMLAQEGVRPQLTIIGSGPEETSLRHLAERLGVASSITFAGTIQGEALVHALNEHKVMVVPSRWEEPFGLVALEGIACGCVVVGSQGGGLKEAIGPCGLTFPNGDSQSLANAISLVLSDKANQQHFRQRAAHHLALHNPAEVAGSYLRVFAGSR